MNTIVVDVGNSRQKWGRCDASRVTAAVSLPLDQPDACVKQCDEWHLPRPTRWFIAGVHPPAMLRLADWLREQGEEACTIDSYQRLPIRLNVEAPERVGIDRLLAAVAANARDRAGRPALIVSTGTAVTINWVDGTGVFQGGAILPGFHLMARALHDFTAMLPEVSMGLQPPRGPGKVTEDAIQIGIKSAVIGAIARLKSDWTAECTQEPLCYLTGGDAPLLIDSLTQFEHWPWMTLEGLRLAAARLE